MKLRLMGTKDEFSIAIPILKDVFNVVEVSDFYKNRGDSELGRVYVEIYGLKDESNRTD